MIVDFKLPHLGDNINSADVIKVNLKEGDKVEIDQVVVEIETDKATVEVPSDISGIVKKVYVKDGQKAEVGKPLIAVEIGEEKKPEIRNQKSEKKLEVQPTNENQQAVSPSKIDLTHHLPKVISIPKDISKVVIPAAPSVRRFAREIGIDITQVTSSGIGGRISLEDVKAYAKKINEQFRQSGFGGIGITKETLPDFSKWGGIERQPMSNIRRKTAEHLSHAWATVPHVTQFDKADITDLENLRKKLGQKIEEAGGKLTVTAILLKVIASAVKVFPQLNSSIDLEKNEIIFKKYINIGVAVDTDRGLLVPVIRNVDEKNINQLSIELQEMSKKARDKKLSLDEMQGGCFTISNLGGIGGTYFTPIVNSPEVAILGISKSVFEPVYIGGKFEPRLIMPLSLSYDHRIIDGADGIRFLRWVVNALENPSSLSFEK